MPSPRHSWLNFSAKETKCIGVSHLPAKETGEIDTNLRKLL